VLAFPFEEKAATHGFRPSAAFAGSQGVNKTKQAGWDAQCHKCRVYLGLFFVRHDINLSDIESLIKLIPFMRESNTPALPPVALVSRRLILFYCESVRRIKELPLAVLASPTRSRATCRCLVG
jgi:hypothetical protein